MPKQYLSIREASEAYGLGRSKIYELLAAGSLSAVKSGTRTLLTAQSLDTYMASLPAATIAPSRNRAA